MTAAGARRWTNDYGDIPRWYWTPRAELVRQARNDPHRWTTRGRSALLTAFMLGAYSPVCGAL